jgi:hypothetical protein
MVGVNVDVSVKVDVGVRVMVGVIVAVGMDSLITPIVALVPSKIWLEIINIPTKPAKIPREARLCRRKDANVKGTSLFIRG